MGEQRQTLKMAKQRLLDQMALLDQTSPEYSKLNTELEKLTKSENNQNGWRGSLSVGLINTLVQTVCSTVNIWSVLRHEDRGNVLTTKSLNYVKKP